MCFLFRAKALCLEVLNSFSDSVVALALSTGLNIFYTQLRLEKKVQTAIRQQHWVVQDPTENTQE